jgi:hypothetical protein
MKRVALTLFAALCVGSVWAEEGETTTPEATPESGSTSSTSKLTIDPSAGYIITGLGELGDQVAVVFTNSAAVATWKAPKDLKNVEFLAVGGGGGGGGHFKHESDANLHQGGAGGGGGAVVTGFIKELNESQEVNITIGAGGNGGTATTSATANAGAGGNGGDTVLKVDNLTYVTAYGGGGDGGYDSTGVANGGSNSGARKDGIAIDIAQKSVVSTDAEPFVSNVVSRGNKGGNGIAPEEGAYPGAGGGGAGSEGGEAGGYGIPQLGGACGYGYVSMITGIRTVYGAGGGGGTGLESGGLGTLIESAFEPYIEGAGVGRADDSGSNAVANRGAGGGGGSYDHNGGAGGSGIVILRFQYFESPIKVSVEEHINSKISDKPYSGEVLTSGLTSTLGYNVEEMGERIDAGEQTVRVFLNQGYVWSDGYDGDYRDFTWEITQNENNWKVDPVLSPTSWPQALAKAGQVRFTPPQTRFGNVVGEISSNGGETFEAFNGVLPTIPGNYIVKYTVEEDDNYSGKIWEQPFTIYPSEAFYYGYRVFGLGQNKDEVAVVFTKSGKWTVPQSIENAEILVVGGGGGGGADKSDDARNGGAGGGGGGVVTGRITRLCSNDELVITIGKGGAGGEKSTSSSTGARAGTTGGDSKLSVNGSTIVTAYGGGGDGGYKKDGKEGGSSGGGRPDKTSPNAKRGKIEGDLIVDSALYGNKGGSGAGYASGGGGGASPTNGVGGNAVNVPDTNDDLGGDGGEGLTSDITGAQLVYGSGGGGGCATAATGGKGGSGAGDANTSAGDRTANGKAAVSNQGGGGGGAGRQANGGAGGSGIVVIRYTLREYDDLILGYDLESEMKANTRNFTFAYTGSNQTVLPEQFFNSNDYEIGEVFNAKAVGEYVFTVTPKRDLWWSDGTIGPKEFTWTIHRIDPSYGYTKQVDGDIVVAFTNHSATAAKWVPDANLKDVQFLAVGGGGGGGGAVSRAKSGSNDKRMSPGAGGGGGGVVVGSITSIQGDSIIEVKVGAGGTKGSAQTSTGGGAGKGGVSWFGLSSSARYITAGGGGAGSAWSKPAGQGGSNAGNRCEVITDETKTLIEANIGSIGDGAPVENVEFMGAVGGNSYSTTDLSKQAAGGGGGATASGADATEAGKGNGGAGYTSLITGESKVYGSGGGGGAYGTGVAAGAGGSGAGNGQANTNTAAGSGSANRGGGGGGGGVKSTSSRGNGGAGGSGIVVFRYNKYPAGVVTADGVVYYETLDAAISAALEGETIKLFADVTVDSYVVVPEGRTLDLNGKSIQARAVVGKLALNGGALKTYDTNTQTYFFMAAPAETDGALYWTSDAVLTIEQDYDLVLESGSVTLPNSWRTLVGQSLTIASGAEFIIPENVTLNLRGNAVVAEDATLTCNGTIALGNSLDTIDTTATLTIGTELESNKIVSAVDGYAPVYNNGTYSLVLAKVYVAEVGGVKFTSLVDAIGAAQGAEVTLLANIELVSSYVTITADTTINLAGNNITSDGDVFIVESGTLTVNGEGKITANTDGAGTACALWANGGNAVINGGTWSCGGDTETTDTAHQNDTIYTKNGGKVTITGGMFEYTAYVWTLNENDKNRKTITVSGGKFKNFNPADNTSEGPKTNFCADGYAAELNSEGYYVVAKLAIAPNGTTEVTASSPDDAASKVTILVPDAMKDVVTADKYAEYFVKSAEYNESTGKYMVTAALNPDVVKPVIAETTADDTTKEAFVIDANNGNVTLNINNKKPGLYYGVQVLKELGADPVAVVPETNGSLLVPAENLPGGNAAFFKVIVDFAPIVVPEAE